MNYIKRRLALLLCGALLPVLAGCSAPAAQTPPAQPEAISSRPIRFPYVWNEAEVFYTQQDPDSHSFCILARPHSGGAPRTVWSSTDSDASAAPTLLCCWEDRVIFVLDRTDESGSRSDLCWTAGDGSRWGIYREELNLWAPSSSEDFFWIPDMPGLTDISSNAGYLWEDILVLNNGGLNLKTGEYVEIPRDFSAGGPMSMEPKTLIGQLGENSFWVQYCMELGDEIFDVRLTAQNLYRTDASGKSELLCRLPVSMEHGATGPWDAPLTARMYQGYLYIEDLRTYWKIDPVTGEKTALFECPEDRMTIPFWALLCGDDVYTVREDGLHRISLTGGTDTLCGAPDGVNPEALSELQACGPDRLVFTTKDNRIFSYTPEQGFRQETPD